MKCGTSTLHHILAGHPDVFMPREEIHFFTLDDAGFDLDRDFDECLVWYRAFFAGARPKQIIGERSSVYLASPEVPHRMAQLIPRVKLLFVTRCSAPTLTTGTW